MYKHFAPLLCFFFALQGIYAQELPPNYNEDWQKVYRFELEDLPRSALEIVDQIQRKAKKDKNSPQLVKTLMYQSKFSLLLEEEAQLEVVRRLEKEIARAKSPDKQLLQSILADLYWQYYQGNRWKLRNRTATDQVVNEDFRSWDSHRLIEQTHALHQASLTNDKALKEASILQYAALLKRAPGSQKFQPTLFDFISQRARVFYSNEESSVSYPADQFVIKDPLAWATNKDFIQWNIPRDSTLSFQREALLILQNLTRFHLNNNQLALSQLTLDRLEYVKSKMVGTVVEADFEKALKQNLETFSATEQAPFLLRLARLYYQQGKRTQDENGYPRALQLTQSIQKDYPKTREALWASKLQKAILNQELRMKTEEYLPLNTPGRLFIEFRNLDQLHFQALEINAEKYAILRNIVNDSLRREFFKKLPLRKKWKASLPQTDDYKKHSTETLLPAMPSGWYVVIASQEKALGDQNTYSYTTYQSTNLSLLKTPRQNKSLFEVVDRRNGAPVASADVRFKSNTKNQKLNQSFKTNTQGFFTYHVPRYYSGVTAHVSTTDDKAVFGEHYLSENYTRRNRKEPRNIRVKTFLFTDRSIYRPGQKLFFKALVLKYPEDHPEKATPLTKEFVEIYIEDPNGEEVGSLELQLNEFGTVAGEFQIPLSGLTGQYSIEIDEGYESSDFYDRKDYDGFDSQWYRIAVEEYKRPRFETTFEALEGSYKVNDSIQVNGEANSFAGSAVSEAKVSYRVVRKPQYPAWYRWYYPDISTAEAEILQGETTTDAQGRYSITFKAKPDLEADPTGLPVFRYTLYADVTDLNGETRSTQTTVNIGYHSLLAELVVPTEMQRTQKKEKIGFRTENLNGEAVPLKGSIAVYKLQPPQTVLRTRIWEEPEIQGFTEEEFRRLFPHDPYTKEEAEVIHWPKGKKVWEKSFDTSIQKELLFGNTRQWETGLYIVVLTSRDEQGLEVKDEKRFLLADNKSKQVSDNTPFEFQLDKPTYTPGEEVILRVGTALPNQHLVVELEEDRKVIGRYPLKLNAELQELRFPTKKEGDFFIKYHWVGMNELFQGQIKVTVAEAPEVLEIETKSFRDKLQPGQKESWSFQIKKGEKGAAAEVLASMYDASLDLFLPHNWTFSNSSRRYTYSIGNTTDFKSFGTRYFLNYGYRSAFFRYGSPLRSHLNWFGLNMSYTSSTQRSYMQELRTLGEDLSSNGGDVVYAKTISGVVTASDGLPLPGATVVVVGTSRGTQTDFDGYYSIGVEEGDVLRISYIGFKVIERDTNESSKMDISLEEDAQLLQEVVVTGYSAGLRSELGNAKMAIAENEEDRMLAVAERSSQSQAADLAVPSAPEAAEASQPSPDLSGIQARTNLQETAFFFPQLRTDKKGNVSFEFNSPEALTRWKLQLFAHNKEMIVGQKTLTTVTQKELMVLPNAPRFLREGDTIVFSTKIASLLPTEMQGYAQLELSNPFTGELLDSAMSNTMGTQEFTIQPKGNTALHWTLIIPKGLKAVQYRIVAKAGNFSDGEQNVLPVLTNRMLVTESLPLWVRSGQEKTFELDKLASTGSTTRTNHQLTLEITSNPVWYAVEALPYLMEYPYECAEQTFSRYYANSLGAYIANSNPKIKEVFAQWKNSEDLVSALEKNQELKSIIIQETPWLRDAQSETEQKKRIGLLFDLTRLEEQQESSLKKLKELQLENGGFPWFKGSNYPNRFITQHIASGFAHLRKLTGESSKAWEDMIEEAVTFLDYEIQYDYKKLLERGRKIRDRAKTKQKGIAAEKRFLAQRHIWQTQLFYLYMRGFYPEIEISENTQAAMDYYLKQAEVYHREFSLYAKGLHSMIQKRNGNTDLAQSIWKSLLENSTENEELGLYWKSNTAGWSWYLAPVETQALLIEAAHEVLAEDPAKIKTIDAMKTWLLKNKQTNRWQTTKATTEAIYAILMTGSDWLAEENQLEVVWGEMAVSPPAEDIQAGTGYYKIRRDKKEVNPNLAKVTLKQRGKGIAWGGLYWQYFEDLDKITSAETPLQLSKKLFRKENTPEGEKLFALEEGRALKLGDLIRVRIEIKVDREMEFVHMKDMRAAGLEPADVLSEYKYQDGLGYYQSTRDAATNFFFDRLPKGVFVFEYDLRVNNAGQFSNGITTIQCMYAPEFTSHSEGVRIEVANE